MGVCLITLRAVSLDHLPPPDHSQSLPSQQKLAPGEKKTALPPGAQAMLLNTQAAAGPQTPWITHPEHCLSRKSQGSITSVHFTQVLEKKKHTYLTTRVLTHILRPAGPPGGCEVSGIRPGRPFSCSSSLPSEDSLAM